MRYKISYSCISHIGNVRTINQDNFICQGKYMKSTEDETDFPITGEAYSNRPLFLGVFDGMGGEECGEIASLLAAERASETSLTNDNILDFINFCKLANEDICEYAVENNIGTMGTTAAMLMFSKKKITLCNIGDSKIFYFSEDRLEQISKDHISISAYGKKPPLSQNLGIPPEEMVIEPYISQGEYNDGDKYLVCSDGLTDMVTVERIEEILKENSIEKATNLLLEEALNNGGRDNITIILTETKQLKSVINLFK